MRVEQIQKKILLILVLVACAYFALFSPIRETTGTHGKQVETSQHRAEQAFRSQAGSSAITDIALSGLPKQGQQTYRLVFLGGPFPYEKDGSVFGNRERLLPSQEKGYYREYTVRTPRVKHRGARRIVCGGWVAHRPKACYYTADHYGSFRLIDASGSGSRSDASVIN